MKRIERIETAMGRIAPDACLDGIAQRAAPYEELARLYAILHRALSIAKDRPTEAAKHLAETRKLAVALADHMARAPGPMVTAYGMVAGECDLAPAAWADALNALVRTLCRADIKGRTLKGPPPNDYARKIACQAANDYRDLTGRTPSRSYKSDFPGFVEEIFRACRVNERPDTIIKEQLRAVAK
jgi:hypothetical protein